MADWNEESLKRAMESLLFVADRPVALSHLSRTLEVDVADIETAFASLTEECQGRGIRVQRWGNEVQMVTAPEMAPYVERFLGTERGGRLSMAALETLAIVAYQQPVTRAQIESIRGVNSERALATLSARGLITEAGRLEGPGRPMLWGTSFEFMEYFGLKGKEDLPPLPE